MKHTTVRVSAIAAGVLAAGIGLALPFVQTIAAQTTELRVLCSNAVKAAVEELRPQIERSVGRRLAIQFDSSQRLRQKIDAGEPFDVAFLGSEMIDELIQKGTIAAGSRADIGRTGVGVGVRAGARKPDVSTPEALKQTLLNAKSITMNPTGASFTHFNRIAGQLGIAEDVKTKLILDPQPGRPQMNVAEGKAELVWTQIPEIRSVPGLELAGALPAALQSYTAFAVGAATKTNSAGAAAALIKFITAPAAIATFRAKDVEAR